jgi:hypothetical protein
MMKIIFFTIFFILSTKLLFPAEIVINEIQYNPAVDEPEWIELYNPNNFPKSLTKASLNDKVTSHVLPDLNFDTYGYIVISKDTLKLLSSRNIPVNTRLIQTSIPIMNNDSDIIVLRSSDSTVLDSISYNGKWSKQGISLERRLWNLPATINNNFMQCKSKDSCTPGSINSVTPGNYDASADSIIYNRKNESYEIYLSNAGIEDISDINCSLYLSSKTQGLNVNNFYQSFQIDLLSAGEIYSIELKNENVHEFLKSYGTFYATVVLNSAADEKKDNDTLISKLYLSYPVKSVTINEFLYDPVNDNAEFIELFNNTSETINLTDWSVRDGSEEFKKNPLLINNLEIEPQDYAVIAWDSVIFNTYPELVNNPKVFIKKCNLNLNSRGDDIVLSDPNGNVHDSLSYLPAWHSSNSDSTKGISLEKFSPELISSNKNSWSSCVDPEEATPGRANSISRRIDSASFLKAYPNPFSPFSKGLDQNTLISFTLPFTEASVTINVFDTEGRKLALLADSAPVSLKGSVIWDGKNDYGYNLEVGPYILTLEATDRETGSKISGKILIVIGK